MLLSTLSRSSRSDAGFSLIEVLVALLVLAIGMLGLAALQTQGIRFNQDAYTRSQATVLAYDLIDRIRANRDDADDYVLDPLDPGGACDPLVSAADNDLNCWFERLDPARAPEAGEAAMPAGSTASLVRLAAPDDNYLLLTLRWVDKEPREFAGGVRLPANQGECEAITNRAWDAGQGTCMVTQAWTFWP